jgi:hypothetical protein
VQQNDQQQADKQSFHGSTLSSQLRESSLLNHNDSPPLLPADPAGRTPTAARCE